MMAGVGGSTLNKESKMDTLISSWRNTVEFLYHLILIRVILEMWQKHLVSVALGDEFTRVSIMRFFFFFFNLYFSLRDLVLWR